MSTTQGFFFFSFASTDKHSVESAPRACVNKISLQESGSKQPSKKKKKHTQRSQKTSSDLPVKTSTVRLWDSEQLWSL